jgi:hypothetical protein
VLHSNPSGSSRAIPPAVQLPKNLTLKTAVQAKRRASTIAFDQFLAANSGGKGATQAAALGANRARIRSRD